VGTDAERIMLPMKRRDATSGRLERESETVRSMIELYCRGQHGASDLCAQCAELLAYAVKRLDECPHGESKPTCRRCPIHCYDDAHRRRIREVMRYAGPRMALRHPWRVVRHAMSRRRRKEDR